MSRTEWLETVESDVPARLDRLPWARWHWVVVAALGLMWILDGSRRPSSGPSRRG